MASPVARAARAGFRPWQIASLTAWWSADVASSMAQASNGTTAVSANNDPVGYWKDLLNGYPLTQSTNNNRPLYQTTGINSRPALSFDGTNDNLNATSGAVCDAVRNTGGFTAFVVARPVTTTILTSLTFLSRNGSAAQSRINVTLNPGVNQATLGGRRLESDSATNALANSAYVYGNNYVFCAVADYANSDGYVYANGSLLVTNTSWLTDGTTPDSASAAVSVGGLPDGATQQYLGQIAQVLWYKRALSASEVLFVSRWLGRIYGVSV